MAPSLFTHVVVMHVYEVQMYCNA